MSKSSQDLGKLIAVHGIAPVYLQRAVFIIILSFFFFLAMMFVYYIRQNLLYFLLASAFLALYLFTLFSFFMQRRNIVKIYENGLSYRDRSARWRDIDGVSDEGAINIRNGKPIVLPKTIHDVGALLNVVRHQAGITE